MNSSLGAPLLAQAETQRWRAADPQRWLVGPVVAKPARLRLLCIPHAGGAPSAFRPWAPLLPPDVELLIAQLPGRESRYAEPALEHIELAVQALADALAALEPLPIVLFGHSMGALIAYELAQTLQARAQTPPLLLTVSGHGSPLNPENYANLLDTSISTIEFSQQVAQRYGGIPAPLLADPALLQFFVPLLRADFRLVASHKAGPRPHLTCPLLVLGGDADPHVSARALDEWRHCTSGEFTVRMFCGEHFYLVDHTPAVLATIWSALPGPRS